MKKIIDIKFSRGASWLLIIYLSVMVSGCTFRPTVISPEEARILQTREFNASPEEVARASVVVLQEMHYTLGNVDMGLGLITANRTSERSLAPISRELVNDSEISDELGTFCVVAGTVAIIGIILAIIFGDDEEDDDDNNRRSVRHHRPRVHHPGPVYVDSNDSGDESYHYSMTITLAETSQQHTKVHVTVQGEHFEGSSINASGPVQDQQFHIDFFNGLQAALNR